VYAFAKNVVGFVVGFENS